MHGSQKTWLIMCYFMRNLILHICENEGANKLCSIRAADQCLCFCFIDSAIKNFKPLAIFCSFTTWFVSDLVLNLEDSFSYDENYKVADQSACLIITFVGCCLHTIVHVWHLLFL